jgi:protein ImuB
MTLTGLSGDLFAPLPETSAQMPCVPARPVSAPAVPEQAPAAVARAPKLWVALRWPALAVSAVRDAAAAAGESLAAQAPLVVLDGNEARPVLVALSPAAAQCGLAVGLGLSAAYARCPELIARPRFPAGEARLLETLASLALRYTPVVCPAPPDELLLEVRASLALFGGLAALSAALTRELGAAAAPLQLAVAPTARAATWLVRAGHSSPVESRARLASALHSLPIACTRWPAETQEALVRFGVRRLGELVRLPREGLARRFPPELLAELDEAFGRGPCVRAQYRTRDTFRERLELEEPAEDLASLAPALAVLIDRFRDFLRRRASGVPALVLRLEHRGRPPTRCRLGRSRPAGGDREWQRLLRERLTHLTLAAPVTALSLSAGAPTPLEGASASVPGLSEPGEAAASAALLLDRLRARLGERAVSGFCLVPEHRPEAAARRRVPREAGRSRRARERPAASPRPLWLLEHPEPVALRAGRPWLDGPLVLESGPERIESGWWDEAPVRRDYYVARHCEGARLWLYREYEAAGGGWFLQGLFA